MNLVISNGGVLVGIVGDVKMSSTIDSEKREQALRAPSKDCFLFFSLLLP